MFRQSTTGSSENSEATNSLFPRVARAEKILGMATILTNPNFDLLARRPKWGDAKLWLIGYTAKGEQIRLTWFDHARLDTA
jgi:hypothetical protein